MPLPGIAGVIGSALSGIWGVFAASPGEHIASLIDRGSGVTPRYWRLHLVAEHPVGTPQPAILIESSDSLAGPWTEQDVIDVSAGQLAGGPGLLVSYAGGVLLALIEEHTTSVQPVATVVLDPDNVGGGGTATVETVPTVYSVPASDPSRTPVRAGIEWLDADGNTLITVYDASDQNTARRIATALQLCSQAISWRFWCGLRQDFEPGDLAPSTDQIASIDDAASVVFSAPIGGAAIEQVALLLPAPRADLLTASKFTLDQTQPDVATLIAECTGVAPTNPGGALVSPALSVATDYLSGVRLPRRALDVRHGF